MAFINERMSRDERNAFASKAIPNPGNRVMTLEPTQWTVDREEDAFLVWGLQEREEPHDYFFLFGWKGWELPVKLRKSWVNANTCVWDLLSAGIPDDAGEHREAIIASLKEALSAYAYNGFPGDPNNATTKVEFNF